MKKSLHLLATAALFAAGAMTASADRYWEANTVVLAEDIQENVKYVLNDGAHYANSGFAYLSGTSFNFTAHPLVEEFITFEKAGNETWYIVNAAGEYLQDPEFGAGYTTNADKKWVVTVKNAVYVTDLDEAKDNEYDLSYVTSVSDAVAGYDPESPSEGVVIASAKANSDASYNYLLGFTPDGKNAVKGDIAYGSNINRNLWVISTVSQMKGFDYWDTVYTEIFGDEGFDEEHYSTGNNPGDYSEEALAALAEAVAAGEEAGSDEEAGVAAENLKEAWTKFQESFVNFGPGFYIFTTYRSPQGAMFDNTGNVAGAKDHLYTYTDPAIAITHTQNGSQFSIGGFDTYQPADVDPENEWAKTAVAPYIIWEVIESDEPGLFYVRNRETGNYIGTPGADKKSNTPIPVVKEPNARFNMAPSSQYKGYWKFYSPELTKVSAWGGGWEMGGLHAPGDVLNMVTWNSETDGSLWYPRAVEPELLEFIDQHSKQPKLNMDLTNLVSEAETTIADGKVYSIFDLSTNLPVENLNVFENLDVDGLVTDAEQLSTNAQESTEGPIENLLDSDCDSYFHSAWSAGDAPKEIVEVEDPETGDINEEEVNAKHWLGLDLRKACNAITVKWITRGNGNVQGRLNKAKIYVSNDGENFTEATEVEFHYTPFDAANKVTVAGEVKNCWVGVASFELGGNYQFVRIEHTTPVHTQAIPWMNGAELRVYEGLQYEYKYDKANSPYESVPAQYTEALEKILATAKEELADELATPETIEALKKALEDFNTHKPNPANLEALIAKAKEIVNTAEVGDAPGYFSQSTIDALQAAIDATGTPSSMTVEELSDAMDKLQAAIDAFQAAINMPENGLYMIVSKSVNKQNYGAGIYAQHSGNNQHVKLGGVIATEVEKTNEDGETVTETEYSVDPEFNMTAGAYWQVEKVAGGLTFKNLYTGLYLFPVQGKEIIAMSEEPYVFATQYANVAGCFNFILKEEDAASDGKYIYANAQPGTGNLVTWGSANGADNSAFEFVPVTESEIDDVIAAGWGDFRYYLEVAGKKQIVTFPVDIDAAMAAERATFYSVIGQDANHNIQLEKATEVKAGQAYILEPVDAEAKYINLTLVNMNVADWAPTHELKGAHNGLCPVWDATVVKAGNGYFNSARDKVILSDGKENEKVAANTGYFTEMPSTTAEGAAFITASGSFLPDGINTIITANDTNKGIYSLTGARMNSVKNLPAGLYIINGKKYLVK